MYELTALGFNPFFKEQLLSNDANCARIAAEHRGGYEVWSDKGSGLAQLAGRLKHTLDSENLPGVGDWVVLQSQPDLEQISIIKRVLKRQTCFLRGAAGRQIQGQVIAANIDIVFIVCGLDNDYNLRRIQRYLARIWASGAQPVIILNKADVCSAVNLHQNQVEQACIGVAVHVISAICHQGLEVIHQYLKHGITAAFVGSSGTGKSTLINTLLGEERMTIKPINSHDGRGCHTTTHRQLIILPHGGIVIDTPGMRELQLYDEAGIDSVFSDIENLSGGCKFKDCKHQSEPGCAVRIAVATNSLANERLDYFLKMKSEAQAYALRHDEHQRRQADKAFGKQIARAKKSLQRIKKKY
ncbi:MAG: ribosome small subunit-dependent GTPase A [Deltaproteobacteria bacterium]|nr:ribosome small subunit-dependent GTPase A [Deltaproteobacteria bacterium]